MSKPNVYEQSVFIRTHATTVERCFTEQALMHKWLNPALECLPVGDWSTAVGSTFNFRLKVPLLAPTLPSKVIERAPGLVVWGFDGFFVGCDRWEAQPNTQNGVSGTTLLNRFEFTIPNPLVNFGFKQFAASWTKKDMESQLQRLKQVAERGL
ncbi:MAG: SRPBCC family protein [Cyanobacteria bacterium P01_D01_bin.105]